MCSSDVLESLGKRIKEEESKLTLLSEEREGLVKNQNLFKSQVKENEKEFTATEVKVASKQEELSKASKALEVVKNQAKEEQVSLLILRTNHRTEKASFEAELSAIKASISQESKTLRESKLIVADEQKILTELKGAVKDASLKRKEYDSLSSDLVAKRDEFRSESKTLDEALTLKKANFDVEFNKYKEKREQDLEESLRKTNEETLLNNKYSEDLKRVLESEVREYGLKIKKLNSLPTE